jgi:capsular exopolysaccharide synthesis family protein
VVTVTSIDAHEGKTTVLINLGMAAASRKRNVLLIDADLRKPRLHDLFKLPNDLGVTDVLPRCAAPGFLENSPLEALVRRTQIPNLWVMPSGPGSATVESLLSSPDLGILLQRFRRDFDLIFIDTPPLAMYADSRIVGRLSDGVVIVIRANTKSREELKSAYARLMQDQIQILGTILNGWRSDPSKTRAYRDYNYNQRPGPRRPA